MGKRGVVYVVYGEAAEREYTQAREALIRLYPDLPVYVMRNRVQSLGLETDSQFARWAKITLLAWSPFRDTLYLDADTRVIGDLTAGWRALEQGWHMAITPSTNQGEDWLWHVSEAERAHTVQVIGFRPVQLQAGVFFIRRSAVTQALSRFWASEWLVYRDQDQGALLRALYRHPVKVFMLSPHFNDGAVIQHRWGAIRKG